MHASDVVIDGPLPGLPEAAAREVTLLPEHLDGGRKIGPYTEARPGALLFGLPGIGRFLIRDGTNIDVWIAPGGDRSAAKRVVLGSALGALIHQRGELAFSGVAMIAPSGAGVALCGASATGKSTVAAALSRRGWFLLVDGIMRITVNSSGGIVWPGEARLQLWHDACETLELNVGELEQVRKRLGKYFVPVPAIAVPTPLEFAVNLQVAAGCRIVEFSPEQRPELFFRSTFRPRQIGPLGQRDAHARAISQVSRSCRAMVLEGARECPVRELADALARIVG
jgi:hypothetical protein